MPTAAFVSFRFSPHDGVSVEARKWAGAAAGLGYDTFTVAAEGADVAVSGLGIDDSAPPDASALQRALAGADLVVVENLCSLPLNPAATAAVARALRGRPAVLHHHDLPWQRPNMASLSVGYPPDDPAWAHVTINHLTAGELARHGITATVIPNCFDTEPPPGDGAGLRAAMGCATGDRLLLHPTRAIPRKNVPAAVALAEAVGATYWLLGPAEDGYGDELERALAGARCPVARGLPPAFDIADAYAAADAVTLTSTWEGFGNATLESALHRRPFALTPWPVAREIAAHGFRWFDASRPSSLARWLERPDPVLLDTNREIARRHFSLDVLESRLRRLLGARGWL